MDYIGSGGHSDRRERRREERQSRLQSRERDTVSEEMEEGQSGTIYLGRADGNNVAVTGPAFDGCHAQDPSTTSFTETDRIEDYEDQVLDSDGDLDGPGAIAISFAAPNLPPRPFDSDEERRPEEPSSETEREEEMDVLDATLSPDHGITSGSARVRRLGETVQATGVQIVSDQKDEEEEPSKVFIFGVDLSKRSFKYALLGLFITVLAAIITVSVILSRSNSSATPVGNLKRQALGDVCESDAQCKSGFCPFGVCTFGGYEDTCTDPGHCLSGYCIDGRCGKSSDGKWCSKNEECVSLICDTEKEKCSAMLQTGEECKVDANCEAGSCRSGTCADGGYDSSCVLNSDCRLSGYCKDRKCSENPPGGLCEVPEGCTTHLCADGICLKAYENGKKCDVDLNCNNGFCDEGTMICTAKLGLNQTCTRLQECASGHCHTEFFTCQEPNPDEGHCSPTEQITTMCQSGFCDIFSRQCVQRKEAGFPCDGHVECASGFCKDRLVCSFTLQEGESCQEDLECLSLNCDGTPGVCMPKIF